MKGFMDTVVAYSIVLPQRIQPTASAVDWIRVIKWIRSILLMFGLPQDVLERSYGIWILTQLSNATYS